MSTLGPDVAPLPSCGSDTHDGAFDWPALAAGAVVNLTAYAGEYIEITWIPAATTDYLEYGSFATQALATTGFDAATDSGTPGVLVPTAPSFLPAGFVQRLVDPRRPWLRVEPSAGTGRCVVRSCALSKAWG
jgi:hypothetical protein